MFDGSLLLRINLRQAARKSGDAAITAAIGRALADPTFCDDTAAAIMERAQANPTGLKGGTLLQQFLAMLIANLPAILALITALFGAAPATAENHG